MALTFAGLALGLSWPALVASTRRVILCVLVPGVFIKLAATAVDMIVIDEHVSPLTDRSSPLFFQVVCTGPMIYTALMLDGLVTLLPLLLIWSGLGWLISRGARKGEAVRSGAAEAAMTNWA